MAKPTLALTLQGEAAERLAALAEASGRTPEWYADFMIREYAGEEMRIVRRINEGIAAADAGQTVSHGEAMTRIDATIARAAHRDAANEDGGPLDRHGTLRVRRRHSLQRGTRRRRGDAVNGGVVAVERLARHSTGCPCRVSGYLNKQVPKSGLRSATNRCRVAW